MITVLCANPALDVTYRVPRLTPGGVHAVAAAHRRAGGKGANTARVLRRLGAAVTLLAPLGGTAGSSYAAELSADGVPVQAVPVAAAPRSSVCVVDDADATVFNEAGPMLSPAEWAAVHAAALATEPAVLVLAGSLPSGVDPSAYAAVVAATAAVSVVDAKGAALAATLAARPAVVAPNLLEAQEIVGPLSPFDAARALCARGARAAVVSAGPDGLAAVTPAGCFVARPPRTLAGNPTGAGDAVTAALAAGLAAGTPWPAILRDAVAVAGATLAAPTAGDFDPAARAALLPEVLVEEILC